MARKTATQAGEAGGDDNANPPERVEALARGLAILKCFGRQREYMTLSEIAEATMISRASARRLLFTLVELGYVEQNGRDFSLTSRVMELGYSFLVSMPWWEIATPHMRRISDALNETCVASVLLEKEVVMVARTSGSHFTAINMPMGTHLPAHATAMGRVLLASMLQDELARYLESVEPVRMTDYTIVDRDELANKIEQARSDGYALVNEELELGLRTIAVPLHDSEGAAIAAIAVSVYAPRVSEKDLEENALPLLLQSANEISRSLPLAGSIEKRRPPMR